MGPSMHLNIYHPWPMSTQLIKMAESATTLPILAIVFQITNVLYCRKSAIVILK